MIVGPPVKNRTARAIARQLRRDVTRARNRARPGVSDEELLAASEACSLARYLAEHLDGLSAHDRRAFCIAATGSHRT